MCLPERPMKTTFPEFLKESKDNIYSLWKPGKVPIKDIIKAYDLTADHLHMSDCAVF
jgi:hypothetical protein